MLSLVALTAAYQAPVVSHLASSRSAFVGVTPAVPEAAAARTSAITMSNIKELRERVGSVKNTKKITSAMRLVAAAKVRRAQEAVLRSRPFSETLERILGGLLQRLKMEALDIPLLETREAKKVGLVVITGDRGLCGGYNSNAIKKAEQRIAELKEQARHRPGHRGGHRPDRRAPAPPGAAAAARRGPHGPPRAAGPAAGPRAPFLGRAQFSGLARARRPPPRRPRPDAAPSSASQDIEVELITVGNKGSTYFGKRATPVRKAVPCGQSPTAAEATAIANELLSSYYAGELDRIELLYTSFVSMISSVPSLRTIIPLTPAGIEADGDEIFKMSTKVRTLAPPSLGRWGSPRPRPPSPPPRPLLPPSPTASLLALLPPSNRTARSRWRRRRSTRRPPPSSRRT